MSLLRAPHIISLGWYILTTVPSLLFLCVWLIWCVLWASDDMGQITGRYVIGPSCIALQPSCTARFGCGGWLPGQTTVSAKVEYPCIQKRRCGWKLGNKATAYRDSLRIIVVGELNTNTLSSPEKCWR